MRRSDSTTSCWCTVDDVRRANGLIEVRSFDSLEAVARLSESVVVNCTGLGADVLFADPGMVPTKGQLTVLRPQPGIDYLVINDSGLRSEDRKN